MIVHNAIKGAMQYLNTFPCSLNKHILDTVLARLTHFVHNSSALLVYARPVWHPSTLTPRSPGADRLTERVDAALERQHDPLGHEVVHLVVLREERQPDAHAVLARVDPEHISQLHPVRDGARTPDRLHHRGQHGRRQHGRGELPDGGCAGGGRMSGIACHVSGVRCQVSEVSEVS